MTDIFLHKLAFLKFGILPQEKSFQYLVVISREPLVLVIIFFSWIVLTKVFDDGLKRFFSLWHVDNLRDARMEKV